MSRKPLQAKDVTVTATVRASKRNGKINCRGHQRTHGKRQRPRSRQRHGPHIFEHTHLHTHTHLCTQANTPLNTHAHTTLNTHTHHFEHTTHRHRHTHTTFDTAIWRRNSHLGGIVPPFMSEAFTFSGPVKMTKTRFSDFFRPGQNPKGGSRTFSVLVNIKKKVPDFSRTGQNRTARFPTDFRTGEYSARFQTRFWTSFSL